MKFSNVTGMLFGSCTSLLTGPSRGFLGRYLVQIMTISKFKHLEQSSQAGVTRSRNRSKNFAQISEDQDPGTLLITCYTTISVFLGRSLPQPKHEIVAHIFSVQPVDFPFTRQSQQYYYRLGYSFRSSIIACRCGRRAEQLLVTQALQRKTRRRRRQRHWAALWSKPRQKVDILAALRINKPSEHCHGMVEASSNGSQIFFPLVFVLENQTCCHQEGARRKLVVFLDNCGPVLLLVGQLLDTGSECRWPSKYME